MTTPATPDIRYEFDAKRERVTLGVGGSTLSLSAVELERLAQFLGVLRSSMSPPVAQDVPDDTAYTNFDTPRLAVQMTKDGLRAALGVRTTGFGWVAILLDRAQAAGLGSHLSSLASTMGAHADRAPDAPRRP